MHYFKSVGRDYFYKKFALFETASFLSIQCINVETLLFQSHLARYPGYICRDMFTFAFM